jgi:hypothetical protein
METALKNGTGNSAYPDNIIVDDFEEFEVDDVSEFKVGDMVEMNGYGEVIPVVDQGNIESGSLLNSNGFENFTNNSLIGYLGNDYYLFLQQRSSQNFAFELIVFKKLKNGNFKRINSEFVSTVNNNTNFFGYGVIRESVSVKDNPILDNGRSIFNYNPDIAYFYISSRENNINHFYVCSFNTITKQFVISKTTNPFGYTSVITNSAIQLLECTVDDSTNLIPVFKVLIYGRANSGFCHLVEINVANLSINILNTLDIGTNNNRSTDSTIQPLSFVSTYKNYKGYNTVNKLILGNAISGNNSVLIILDITNTISSGSPVVITGKIISGIGVMDNNQIVVGFNSGNIGLSSYTWSGNSLTAFGTDVSLYPNISSSLSASVISRTRLSEHKFINIKNNCLLIAFTNYSNQSYPHLLLVKVNNDSVNTFAIYSKIRLSEQTNQDVDTSIDENFGSAVYFVNNLIVTEKNILNFNVNTKSDFSDNYRNSSIHTFYPYNFKDLTMLYSKGLNKQIYFNYADNTNIINSADNSPLSLLNTSPLNCVDFIDSNKTLIMLRNNSSIVKLVTTDKNGLILNEIIQNLAITIDLTQPRTIFIKVISKSPNGDFKFVYIYQNSSGHILGRIINFNNSTQLFTANSEFVLGNAGSYKLLDKIVLLHNNVLVITAVISLTYHLIFIRINGNSLSSFNNTTASVTTGGANFANAVLEPINGNIILWSYLSNWQTGVYQLYYGLFTGNNSNPQNLITISNVGFTSITNAKPTSFKYIPLKNNAGITHLTNFGNNSISLPTYTYKTNLVNIREDAGASGDNIPNGVRQVNSIFNNDNDDSNTLLRTPFYPRIHNYCKISNDKFAVIMGFYNSIMIKIYNEQNLQIKEIYSIKLFDYMMSASNSGNTTWTQESKFYSILKSTNRGIEYFIWQQDGGGSVISIMKGIVSPRNYLGHVAKIKNNSIIVTKKPFKINNNIKNKYVSIGEDGTQIVENDQTTPINYNNVTIDYEVWKNNNDGNNIVGFIDDKNIFRPIQNPKFANNGW